MNITKIKKNQKIYFICTGTSTNDIIDSLNKNIIIPEKPEKSIFNIYFKKQESESESININKTQNEMIPKIEKDEFSKLTNLGIKECLMCQENNENYDLFKNILQSKNNIYTSLDYNVIESSFILFHKFNDLKINPLPFMSNNTNIKSKKTLITFKNKFGKSNNITNLKNYWSTKTINNQFTDIKNISSKIVWNYINNEKKNEKVSSLNTLNINEFKKILENLVLSKYKNFTYYDIIGKNINNLENIDSFIFICNPKFLEHVLNISKEMNFNKNLDIIENTSLWEITIDIHFELNKNYKKMKKSIKYHSFKKRYPIEYNCKPLKYNVNNTFSYKFNNNSFILFNSLESIPLQYLKKIPISYLSLEKRAYAKKILNKLENNKKNKNNNKKENNNTNKIVFEDLD